MLWSWDPQVSLEQVVQGPIAETEEATEPVFRTPQSSWQRGSNISLKMRRAPRSSLVTAETFCGL
jgi:hypothetical protein